MPHNLGQPVVVFRSIRSGKTCGLRSGIGKIAYDALTFAWALTGFRGAPLRRQDPSAVQLFRPHPHASSLFPDRYILLKALERRTVIMRPRLGKVEEDAFGGC